MHFEDYFRPTKDYFWQWEDDANVIAVPGGSTIVYYQPVMEVLTVLSKQGLPQFGPLLLTLVALSHSRKNLFPEIRERLVRVFDAHQNPDDLEMLHQGFQFLELIAALPESYKTGSLCNAMLLAVFENVHNQIGHAKAKGILQNLRGRPVEMTRPNDQIQALEMFRFEFRILALLLRQFPDQSAILNKMASMPTIEPEIFELEPDSSEDVLHADFVEELIQNDKTFYVGALIKRIWSGLNIPVHSQLPSDQPLGGISDLTNKGDFDKLLISEFANDDLVLMSRLANQEALYIRREIPPARNNLHRIILLDVSIKNWGTPKTLAYAAMIAIAQHPKTDISCTAFAVGDDIVPIGFGTVDEVISGLQKMSGSLDPSQGLQKFIQLYGVQKNIEVVLISSADTMQLPAIKKIMFEHPGLWQYWMLTSVDGRISLYKRLQNARKHVQDLVLPLTELWEKTRKPEKRRVAEDHPGLPGDIPLLFHCGSRPGKMMLTAGGEIFIIHTNRSLMKAADAGALQKRGWELVYKGLPPHINSYQIGKMDDGTYVLLLFNMQNREITLLYPATGAIKLIPFPDWRASRFPDFYFQENRFYFLTDNQYWIVEPGTGLMHGFNTGPDSRLIGAYENHKSNLENATRSAFYYQGILKKVDKVYLNSRNNIMLNTLEICLKNNKQIYITSEKLKHGILAEATFGASKNEFVFPEGSKINLMKEGMLRFTSSDRTISVFYIPTVIDYPVAIGEEKAMAGNLYFCPVEQPASTSHTQDIDVFWQNLMGRFTQHIQNSKS